MKIKGRLDINKMVKRLKATEKNLPKVLTDPLYVGARTMCGTLAVFTEPGTETTRRQFAGRIDGDIKRLFSIGSLYDSIHQVDDDRADQMWYLYKAGDIGQVRSLLKTKMGGKFAGIKFQKTVPKAVHQAGRTSYRGRVPKMPDQKTVVYSADNLRKYIGTRQKKIGAAAAGYMAAGKSVPITSRIKNVPKWKNIGAHRKSKNKGRVVFKKRSGGMRGSVFNDVDYVRNAITKPKRRLAEKIAKKKMVKAFVIALRKSVKKRFK